MPEARITIDDSRLIIWFAQLFVKEAGFYFLYLGQPAIIGVINKKGF